MNIEHPAPLIAPEQRVLPEWIDYNGHMNVAYYVLAFDIAVDVYLEAIDFGEAYKNAGTGTSFALQSNVRYLGELKEGDPIKITCQLLDFNHKCTHYFMQMYHATEGYLAATAEQVNVHIGLPERRSTPLPDHIIANLESMLESHSKLGTPEGAGAAIGIRR